MEDLCSTSWPRELAKMVKPIFNPQDVFVDPAAIYLYIDLISMSFGMMWWKQVRCNKITDDM